MISLNTIYLTYKLNHSTFKVKDLQQVPQHFLEKNPNSFSWPINKVLLVVPSASSLTGHSPPHPLRLQEHWPHFCLLNIPNPIHIQAFARVEFSLLTFQFSALISLPQGPSLDTILKNNHLFHHSTYWNCHNPVVDICFLVCGLCYCLSHPYLECEVIPSSNSFVVPTNLAQHLACQAIKNVLTGSRTQTAFNNSNVLILIIFSSVQLICKGKHTD